MSGELGTLFDTCWSPQRDWSDVQSPLVFYNLSFDLYASIPALNRGVIREIDRATGGSPKRAKAMLDGRIRKDSNAMRFGREAHSYIVEGEEAFQRDCLVSTGCCGLLSSGARSGETCGKNAKYYDGDNWFCGSHKPSCAEEQSEFVTEGEFNRIKRMLESIRESDAATLLSRPSFVSELTVVWPVSVQVVVAPSEARRFGVEITKPVIEPVRVLLKTRIDRFAPPGVGTVDGERVRIPGEICDLKKCRAKKLSDKHVSNAINDYGLDIQAAMCIDAMAAIGYPESRFSWLFAEDDEAFDCVVKDFGGEDLEDAQWLYRDLVRQWAECVALSTWPGHCSGRTNGMLPTWRTKQIRNARMENEEHQV